jgi:hypothetical protein
MVYSRKSIFPKHIFEIDFNMADSALSSLTEDIKKNIAPPL